MGRAGSTFNLDTKPGMITIRSLLGHGSFHMIHSMLAKTFGASADASVPGGATCDVKGGEQSLPAR